MAGDGQTIFLMEIFVDNVRLQNCAAGKEGTKTCVRLKLLDYPMLEILESEFCGVPGESCSIKYDLGKSCLFSMKRQPLGRRKSNAMNLDVNVVQMTSSSGSNPTLGRATVNLKGSFTSLLQSTGQSGDKGGPTSQVVKDTYQLTDEGGKTIGEINLFVRLSSFGDIIVTQFQMSGLESNSFLFKEVSDIRGKQFEASGGDGLAKQQSSCRDQSQKCPTGPSPPSCSDLWQPPQTMDYAPPGCPTAQPSMMFPGGPPPGMLPPDYNGPPMSVMGPPMPPGLVAPPPLPDYKDIKATINGHVLNIKVLRKVRKLKPPEVVFCQKLRADDDDDSASGDSRNQKTFTKKGRAPPPAPASGSVKKGPCCPPTDCASPTGCGSPCCQPCPDPSVTLCKCDIPAPPCCATVALPPCPPSDCKPEKKKKKKSGGNCQFTITPQQLSSQQFRGFPVLPQPAAASLDQRNFLVSMEPRQDWPSAYFTPPHQLTNCITVRGTQYEVGDTAGEKGKGGKQSGKQSKAARGKKGKK